MERENRAKPNRKGGKKRYVLLWVFGALLLLAVAVLIHYRGVKPIVIREYGSAVTPADFTEREATIDGDLNKPACGWHALNLKIGGVPTLVLLHVVDTTAPTAEPVDQTVPLGAAPGPDTFVSHIRDADVVRIAFETAPDFNREWEGTLTIILTDGSGNATTVPVRVSVRAVVPSLCVEAGDAIPEAERFLIAGADAVCETEITADMLCHVGTYPIRFMTSVGVSVVSELVVVDTAAPQAKGGLLQLAPEETAEPAAFVTEAIDATDLTYAFVRAPDYGCREVQPVVVRVTDEGGNTVDVESTLFITGVRPRVIEARRDVLTKYDFENRQGQTVTVEPFIPDTPGSYAVEAEVNGVRETFAITVVDTTPPTVMEKPLGEKTFYARYGYLPEDFFTAEDLSAVTLAFADGTDLDTPGEQRITVTATDAYGNATTAERTVTLKEDRNPPRLYGVINRNCYVNEPIAYLSEVFAEDAEDGDVTITVDSEVNSYEKGSYTVVYRAQDRSGNVTEQTCTFTLIARTVTEEELRKVTQSIMEEITTPDMVKAEKLKAIFHYVKKHIKYANGVNHNYTDWRKAAYDGYTQGTGDCYNIYSLTRALLDEAGIRYLSVERLKAGVWRTRHFWVLVNLGTGWYVFDPTWTPRHRFECFMWTKAQCNASYLYWNYKESEYPPLAKERFDFDAVVEMERKGLLP